MAQPTLDEIFGESPAKPSLDDIFADKEVKEPSGKDAGFLGGMWDAVGLTPRNAARVAKNVASGVGGAAIDTASFIPQAVMRALPFATEMIGKATGSPELEEAAKAGYEGLPDWFSLTGAINKAIEGVSPDLAPKTKGELGFDVFSQVLAGAKSPAQLARLKPQNLTQNISALGSAGGAGYAATTETPIDDMLLPIMGAFAPPLAAKGYDRANFHSKKLLGSLGDVNPEKVMAQEAAHLPINAVAASDSERFRQTANRLGATLIGKDITDSGQRAGRKALKQINRFTQVEDALSPTGAGGNLQAGLNYRLKDLGIKGGELSRQLDTLVEGQAIEPTILRRTISDIVGSPEKYGYTNVEAAANSPVVKLLKSIVDDDAFKQVAPEDLLAVKTYTNALDDANLQKTQITNRLKEVAGELTAHKKGLKQIDPYLAAPRLQELNTEVDSLTKALAAIEDEISNATSILKESQTRINNAPVKLPNSAIQRTKQVIADLLPNSDFERSVKSGITRRAEGGLIAQQESLIEQAGEIPQNVNQQRKEAFQKKGGLERMVGKEILGDKEAAFGQTVDPQTAFKKTLSMAENEPTVFDKVFNKMMPQRAQRQFRRTAHAQWAADEHGNLNPTEWAENWGKLSKETKLRIMGNDADAVKNLEILKKGIDTYRPISGKQVGVAGFPNQRAATEITPVERAAAMVGKIAGVPLTLAGITINSVSGNKFAKMLSDPKSVKIMAGLTKFQNTRHDWPNAKANMTRALTERLAALEDEDKQDGIVDEVDSNSPAPANPPPVNQPFEPAPLPETQEGNNYSPQFKSAIQTVFKNEGEHTTEGTPTMMGIDSEVWPKEYKELMALPESERQAYAEKFYNDNFWEKYDIGSMPEDVQELALDTIVNHGGNSTFSRKLLRLAKRGISKERLIKMREAEYRRIAKTNPAKRKYLKGWTNRAASFKEYDVAKR